MSHQIATGVMGVHPHQGDIWSIIFRIQREYPATATNHGPLHLTIVIQVTQSDRAELIVQCWRYGNGLTILKLANLSFLDPSLVQE